MSKQVKKPKFKLSEADFLKMILEIFEGDPNILLWRQNTGTFPLANRDGTTRMFRAGQKGAADITGIIKEYRCGYCNRLQQGIRIEIEVKGTDGKLSDHQNEWLDNISEYNAICVAIWPEENDMLPTGFLRQRLEHAIWQQCPECYKKQGKQNVRT